MTSSSRLLRFAEVTRRTGLSRPRIYSLIAAGRFPRQVPLGPCSVAFVEEEIDRWIAQRIAARDAKPTS